MPSSLALGLRSYRQQHLLVEYASLQQVQLQGMYVSLTPGDQSLWTGVLFVRKGPFGGAILRFRVRFPDAYPKVLPRVIFTTGLYHPLVFAGENKIEELSDDSNSSRAFGKQESPVIGQLNLEPGRDTISKHGISIVSVLVYVRSCFQDEAMLDSVTSKQAVNLEAWHAWRRHRNLIATKQNLSLNEQSNTDSDANSMTTTSEEDDMWAQKIMMLVDHSAEEAIGHSEDTMFQFTHMSEDELRAVKGEMHMRLPHE